MKGLASQICLAPLSQLFPKPPLCSAKANVQRIQQETFPVLQLPLEPKGWVGRGRSEGRTHGLRASPCSHLSYKSSQRRKTSNKEQKNHTYLKKKTYLGKKTYLLLSGDESLVGMLKAPRWKAEQQRCPRFKSSALRASAGTSSSCFTPRSSSQLRSLEGAFLTRSTRSSPRVNAAETHNPVVFAIPTQNAFISVPLSSPVLTEDRVQEVSELF